MTMKVPCSFCNDYIHLIADNNCDQMRELRLGGGRLVKRLGSGEIYRGSTRINALCRELQRMKRITIGHEKIHKGEVELNEHGEESPCRRGWLGDSKESLSDKEMRVGIRYLRNLGSFRRLGVVSPTSKDKLGINFKPKLFSDAVFFAQNPDEESCSPVSPRKNSVSPFSLSGDY